MEPKKGDTIVVWFSCGAASAVALYLTKLLYGHICKIRAVNNPVREEDTDNRRFLEDVSKWMGIEVESATSSVYPDCSAVTVWDDRNYMAGPSGAPCTTQLKKKARQEWENRNKFDWMVLGFTTEEEARHDRFSKTERDNVLPVLISAGFSKQACYNLLLENGVKPPRMYELGYPNANCIGCAKASSPTYWNHVRKVHPEVFEQRAVQSRRIGAKLVRYKGKRIYLDELPPGAQGRPLKSMTIDCSSFCEEKEL